MKTWKKVTGITASVALIFTPLFLISDPHYYLEVVNVEKFGAATLKWHGAARTELTICRMYVEVWKIYPFKHILGEHEGERKIVDCGEEITVDLGQCGVSIYWYNRTYCLAISGYGNVTYWLPRPLEMR